VILPLGGLPEVETYPSYEEFLDGIRDWLSQEVRLMVFQGQQHFISRGPLHYLLAADNERRPLFELPSPDELEPAMDFFVGDWGEDKQPGDDDDGEGDSDADSGTVTEKLPADYPQIERETPVKVDVVDDGDDDEEEWYEEFEEDE
jgi:hypothetical protein